MVWRLKCDKEMCFRLINDLCKLNSPLWQYLGPTESAVLPSSGQRITLRRRPRSSKDEDTKELFQCARWPWEVNPTTASASLRESVLTVVAKKTGSAQIKRL
jgi:hypothetical protein